MTLRAAVRLRRGAFELNVRVSAEPGSVLAVLGPNGAGKTTLLRVLAGLEACGEGRVELDGGVLDAADLGIFVRPEARPVGVVFQDHLHVPHLTVLENVAFGLRRRGARDARAQARRWLERVGVGDLEHRRPAALSGGQAQRVALARALAYRPRLLLLDEPLAALDATSRREVRRELARQLEEFGGVRVLVTHDALEAAALASTLIVIEAGRVVQAGSFEEVRARPRTPYVADLVGANLWRGSGGEGQVRVDGHSLSVAGRWTGDVFALVRPRAVALYRGRPAGSPRNAWPGRVSSVDPEGDRVRVSVAGPLPVLAEVTPAAVAELGLAPGEAVWVAFKATEVEVYPV